MGKLSYEERHTLRVALLYMQAEYERDLEIEPDPEYQKPLEDRLNMIANLMKKLGS